MFFILFLLFEVCLFFYTGVLNLNVFLYNFRYEPLFFFSKLLNFDNISLIGTLLFNFYFLLFIFLGIVLLIAMICVIFLILEIESNIDVPIKINTITYIKKKYD
jgi:NADH:ubiquinone oxidoreductase subunit 6 (subunit J)